MSDRYQLIGKIGIGGMARVLLARDTRIGRDIAIKVLHPQFADNSEVQERFITETKTSGQLNHPNIVAIYDVGSDFYQEIDGADKNDLDASTKLPYLLMEYVPGIALDKVIARSPQPDLRLGLSVCYQMCQALHTAHKHGIVHRDVKPSNILVCEDGRAKLTDFGIARFIEASTAHNTMAGMGTAAYMSPEQIRGDRIGPASDIYSLGCTLFAALTGRSPYQMDSFVQMHKHIEEPIPVIHEVNPQVPATIDPIIQKALAKAVADRYESALDLAEDLAEQLLLLGGELPDVSAGRSALSGGSALPTGAGNSALPLGPGSSSLPPLPPLDISIPNASAIPTGSGTQDPATSQPNGAQITGENKTQMPGLGAPVRATTTGFPANLDDSHPATDDRTNLAGRSTTPGGSIIAGSGLAGSSSLPGESAIPGSSAFSGDSALPDVSATPGGSGLPGGSAVAGESALPEATVSVGASAQPGSSQVPGSSTIAINSPEQTELLSDDRTQLFGPDQSNNTDQTNVVTNSETRKVTLTPAEDLQATSAIKVDTDATTSDKSGDKSSNSKKIMALLVAAALFAGLTVTAGIYFANSSKESSAQNKAPEPPTVPSQTASAGKNQTDTTAKSGYQGWKVGNCLTFDSENSGLIKTDCTSNHLFEIAKVIEFKDPNITTPDPNSWPFGETQSAIKQCKEQITNLPGHLAVTGWDIQIDHQGSYYNTQRLCLLSNFSRANVNIPSFKEYYAKD